MSEWAEFDISLDTKQIIWETSLSQVIDRTSGTNNHYTGQMAESDNQEEIHTQTNHVANWS